MSKVFIGLPVYNGERFLREAIDSLLDQSFRDFTLYISDDASTDDTADVCAQYARQDPRVVYHRQPTNLGMFANFKFVLDAATSEYFMWAAQDDLRKPNYLEICVSALERDTQLGLATTVVELVDTFGRPLAQEVEVARLSETTKVVAVTRYMLQPEGLGKCNVLYGLFRTHTAHAVWHAYPQRKVWGQDYLVALALVSRYKVHIDIRPLFIKRLGGYSSPTLSLREVTPLKPLTDRERARGSIPFKRFAPYFKGSMEALRGTPYRPLAAILLFLRAPRSFVRYALERNYVKFFKHLLSR